MKRGQPITHGKTNKLAFRDSTTQDNNCYKQNSSTLIISCLVKRQQWVIKPPRYNNLNTNSTYKGQYSYTEIRASDTNRKFELIGIINWAILKKRFGKQSIFLPKGHQHTSHISFSSRVTFPINTIDWSFSHISECLLTCCYYIIV